MPTFKSFKIAISNQKPVVLPSTIDLMPKVDPAVDVSEYIEQSMNHFKKLIIDPLYAPLSGQSATIKDMTDAANIHDITPDDLKDAFTEALYAEDRDAEGDKQLSTVLQRSLRYTTPNDNSFSQQIAVQNLVAAKLPLPSSTQLYTPSIDLIPPAKDLLVDFANADYRNAFSNGFSGLLLNRPIKDNILYIAVKNPTAYQAITTALAQAPTKYAGNLSQEVITKLQDIAKVKMKDNLTTWLLGSPEMDSYSLVRILQPILAALDPLDGFLLPLSLRQTAFPTNVSFLNIDNIAHTTAADFNRELTQLQNALATMTAFNIQKMSHVANANNVNVDKHKSHNYDKHVDGVNRAVTRKFKGMPMTSNQQVNLIKRVVKRYISHQQSDNTFRSTQTTFMRPNRRHPNDPNLRGHITRVAYRPDIHIYLDTSGSISEYEYKNAVMTLIKIAKALDTNLFFTSFSHFVAQPVKLPTKGRSTGAIYRTLQKVPKAGGGTEYENVWRLIDLLGQFNLQHGRAYQLNFIITDFEYSVAQNFAPNLKGPSTTRTYYLPILSSSGDEYQMMVRAAEYFARCMIMSGDRKIKNRMLL